MGDSPVLPAIRSKWSCLPRYRRASRRDSRRENVAVTPRNAAKRPNCLTRLVTAMMGSACEGAVLGSFTVEWFSSEKPTARYRVTPFEEPCESVMFFGGSVLGVPDARISGFRRRILRRTFGLQALAWNTPSFPKLPSASACELSLNVSGGASVPRRLPAGSGLAQPG